MVESPFFSCHTAYFPVTPRTNHACTRRNTVKYVIQGNGTAQSMVPTGWGSRSVCFVLFQFLYLFRLTLDEREKIVNAQLGDLVLAVQDTLNQITLTFVNV